jgi:hypothetical protein
MSIFSTKIKPKFGYPIEIENSDVDAAITITVGEGWDSTGYTILTIEEAIDLIKTLQTHINKLPGVHYEF